MIHSVLSFLLLSCISSNAFAKPLTKEKEEFYINEMCKGDEKAKNILVERNLRLVAHIAKKYNSLGLGSNYSEELISIGTIGLIKGINSFKPDKNTRLATYVARCIENEMLMFLRSSKKYRNDISLQEPISFDNDGNEVSILDKLADTRENTEQTVEINTQIQEMLEKIDEVLTEKEKFILFERYGINTIEKTQKDLAKILGISRSYVSRIEKKALQKLNKSMNQSDFLLSQKHQGCTKTKNYLN